MHPLLAPFLEYASSRGIADNSFMVGGAVRDILTGGYGPDYPKDIDMAVPGNSLGIAEDFARKAGGSFVLLDSDFGTARVVRDGSFLDISALKGSSIYTDLAERDITINAMAVPLAALPAYNVPFLPSIIIDPFNGRDDLANKVIRIVSEQNLINDPLRLLRVHRFAAVLGFTIMPGTADSVKRLSSMITSVAVERISEELRHILRSDNSFLILRAMADDGLLFQIFPEVDHDGGKILATYQKAEEMLNNLNGYFADHAGHISVYFEKDYRKICLKFSTLFQVPEAAGNAAMRLKMSGKETGFIQQVSMNRNAVPRLFEESGGSIDRIKVIRLLKEFQIYPLLLAGITLAGEKGPQITAFCNGILDLYHEEIKPRMARLPLITGDDLINEFKLDPSPLFKTILDRIEDMFLLGQINSREEAFKKVGEILGSGS